MRALNDLSLLSWVQFGVSLGLTQDLFFGDFSRLFQPKHLWGWRSDATKLRPDDLVKLSMDQGRVVATFALCGLCFQLFLFATERSGHSKTKSGAARP